MSKSILRDALKLDIIPRWQLEPMLRTQSVAEHSYRVAAITLALCVELGVDSLTKRLALTWAILHDVPESETGDIDFRVKPHLASCLHPLEHSACPWYEAEYANIPPFIKSIVKIADYIEGAAYAQKWAHPDDRHRIVFAAFDNMERWIVQLMGEIPGSVNGPVHDICVKVADEAGAIPYPTPASYRSPAPPSAAIEGEKD